MVEFLQYSSIFNYWSRPFWIAVILINSSNMEIIIFKPLKGIGSPKHLFKPNGY